MRLAEPEFGQEGEGTLHGCVKFAVVVVALSLGWSGFSGLEVPATADAQTRPQPEELWQAYPLHQRPARTVERDDPSEPAGRAPGLAAPMDAGDMGSAVPALLAISLILTAFLVGGALGLVDLPVKLRGGLAAAHAPAAPRRSAARTTAAAVSGAPAPGPELEALEAAEARVFVPVRCEIVCRSDSTCSRFAVVGFGTDGTYVWLAESPPFLAADGRQVGRSRAAVAAHQRLMDQLTEQGWEPAGHGECLVRSQVPTERAVWCLIMDRKSATFSPAPTSSRPRCSPAPAWPRARALLGGLADGAASQPSRKQDVEILNFGLLLEELQAAFYADALQRGSLKGELRQFAEHVGAQEEEHAELVRKALGDDARRIPAFDFGDATGDAKTFGTTARELEDLGVAAYNTQAPNLTKDALGAAARIVSVEARHAAWIRRPVGREPGSLRVRASRFGGGGHEGAQPYGLPRVDKMSDLTLTTLDRDGALLEPLAELQGATRAEFLSKAALGGATLLAAFAAPPDAEAQSAKRDIAILNYALALEYLQDSFYSEVERLGGFSGELGRQASVVGAHERAHVEALRERARQPCDKPGPLRLPRRDGEAGSLPRTAVAFEDLAVAAYKGQAPYISDGGLLVAALGIHTVEARHAAWIRRLAGSSPAPTAFDEPRTRKSVLTLVARTNFTMETGSTRSPRFTG